ncbi:hypothetical protein UFOVP354_54 [uncultured Caudovirales phage]|uniref:Uncharacterized protein n=1 Tax=uncultured Caudovirales phage TaxID=2100421 RepID=A0A6J5LZ04_9CAUD|nr:hypothetical protein UFOVP354_54 [uncultured Caudovirales phage]
MNKLYPIGTQLITRRLSQAALSAELGFSVDSMRSFEPEDGFADFFAIGTDDFDIPWDTWRVTVTKENQKWLSPVPMVGDLVSGDCRRKNEETLAIGIVTEIKKERYHCQLHGEFLGEHTLCQIKSGGRFFHLGKIDVEKRTYPNGQRAPLIEWDEVIEQAVGERK